MFYAKDGWGLSNESVTEGYYRIFAWSSLTSDRGQTTLKMTLPFINSTSRDFEIELDPIIDLECDFIDVRVCLNNNAKKSSMKSCFVENRGLHVKTL